MLCEQQVHQKVSVWLPSLVGEVIKQVVGKSRIKLSQEELYITVSQNIMCWPSSLKNAITFYKKMYIKIQAYTMHIGTNLWT